MELNLADGSRVRCQQGDWMFFLPEVPKGEHPVFRAGANNVALRGVFGQRGNSDLLTREHTCRGRAFTCPQVPDFQLTSHIAHYQLVGFGKEYLEFVFRVKSLWYII